MEFMRRNPNSVHRESEEFVTNWAGLSQRFFHLFLSQEMFDIQLQVGTEVYVAHKLILSASSDVFKAMLNNNRFSEASKQTIELKEDPLCAPHFEQFMFYIYTGQFYVSHSTVCPLLMLADKYNVTDLIPMCRNYMLNNLDAPSNQSCVLQWWRYADLRSDRQLKNEIQNYISLNFERICQTPDFFHASLETVEKFISNSRLVVSNELLILCAVLRWVQDYTESQNITVSKIMPGIKRLLKHLRWPLMMKEELNVLRNIDFFQEILNHLGWEFHPFPPYLSLTDQSSVPCLNELFIENLKVDTIDHTHKITSTSSPSSSRSVSKCLPVKPCGNCNNKKGAEQKLCTESDFCPALCPDQYLSRIYVNDFWATELLIHNYSDFQMYKSQTFFFSTPKLGFYNENDSETLEWEVELHPKGVHFPPAIMIGVHGDGNKLIEEVYNDDVVRLSVMSRSPQEMPLKVEVNILVRAKSQMRPGENYFKEVCSRICLFEEEGQRQVFDKIVSVSDINQRYLLICDCENHINTSDQLSMHLFSLCIVIRPLPP